MYHILGDIIEHVSGESLDVFIKKNILNQLEMNSSKMNIEEFV